MVSFFRREKTQNCFSVNKSEEKNTSSGAKGIVGCIYNTKLMSQINAKFNCYRKKEGLWK